MPKRRTAKHNDLIHPLAKRHPGKICKWCGGGLPRFKKSFCSQHCIHEWSMRTSTSYVRSYIIKRDRGICASCGLNTILFEQKINQKYGKKSAKRDKILKRLGFHPNRAICEVDHVLEVCKGGGLSGENNYICLCYKCHKDKTTKLMKAKAK